MTHDSIWFYEIEGKRFELIKHPIQYGVFSSRKNYYIVVMKNNNIAIFLWRGKNQTILNYKKAHELILDSKFRKEYEKQTRH